MKKWDMNFLMDKKNYLLNRYSSTRSEKERYNICSMINCIDQAIDYISSTPLEEDDYSVLDSIFDDLDYYNLTYPFLSDVTNLFQSFYYSLPCIPSEYQVINTSKNSILKVSKDFYYDVRSYLGERLNINERNGNLRVRFESTHNSSDFEAQTFPIYGTDMTLVSSNINNNIGDYFNLIHEYGHVLNNSFYKYQLFDKNKYALNEVGPIFFELVAGDYLVNQGYDKKEINKSFIHIFRDAVTGAGIDTYRMDLIRNRKKFSCDEDVEEYLFNNFEDNYLINYVINNPLSENFHYVFSYLIAVELYMLYLSNPDDALNKLIRIMRAKDLKPNGYYKLLDELNIIPLSSMSEYLNSIMEKQISYGI